MKKWIFWLIVAVVVIGLGLYLKFAGFGDALMAVVFGGIGLVVGWVAKILYDKYIKE